VNSSKIGIISTFGRVGIAQHYGLNKVRLVGNAHPTDEETDCVVVIPES